MILFNIVFDTGILPEPWLIGNLIPIFKNKCSSLEAKNYGPITLLSCLGEIFPSILNKRLSVFIDDFNILNENQAGFRHGYSTTDNIFFTVCCFRIIVCQKEKITPCLRRF